MRFFVLVIAAIGLTAAVELQSSMTTGAGATSFRFKGLATTTTSTSTVFSSTTIWVRSTKRCKLAGTPSCDYQPPPPPIGLPVPVPNPPPTTGQHPPPTGGQPLPAPVPNPPPTGGQPLPAPVPNPPPTGGKPLPVPVPNPPPTGGQPLPPPVPNPPPTNVEPTPVVQQPVGVTATVTATPLFQINLNKPPPRPQPVAVNLMQQLVKPLDLTVTAGITAHKERASEASTVAPSAVNSMEMTAVPEARTRRRAELEASRLDSDDEYELIGFGGEEHLRFFKPRITIAHVRRTTITVVSTAISTFPVIQPRDQVTIAYGGCIPSDAPFPLMDC